MKAAPPPGGAGPASRAAAPLAAWAVFAIWYFLFAFRPGLLRSDDFGYLRSIIGTLERGRPYTYDWLAPYGATLSSVCALLYRLTGNFYLSTYGFQAFCVLAGFLLLNRLLARRLPPWPAAVLTLACFTFPLAFAKAADFHGGMSTLALFLAALLAYEAGRPAWFFLAAFLAFANRQSHLALLVLPLWAFAAPSSAPGTAFASARVPGSVSPPSRRALAAWGCAFLAAAACLHLGMNRTYAMAHAVFTGSGTGRISAVTLAFLAGGFTAMACLAIFRACFRPPGEALAANLKRPARPLLATLVLLAMTRFWPPGLIMTDTPLFGLAAWPQVNAVWPWVLLACVWFLDFRLLRPSPYLGAIAGFIAIASLRGVWWDYYFLEIMVLGLLLAAGADRDGNAGPVRAEGISGAQPARLSRLAPFLLAAILAANLAYAYLLRVQMDKQKVAVLVLERLERQGRISVDRMTGATFGYLGWKLFDYFLANEGRRYGDLADFLGYVRKDRVMVETWLPWRSSFKAALPPGAELLEEGPCTIGFRRARYRVADLHGPQAGIPVQGRFMTLDSSRFQSPRLPLDNREWGAWLDSLGGGEGPGRGRAGARERDSVRFTPVTAPPAGPT